MDQSVRVENDGTGQDRISSAFKRSEFHLLGYVPKLNPYESDPDVKAEEVSFFNECH